MNDRVAKKHVWTRFGIFLITIYIFFFGGDAMEIKLKGLSYVVPLLIQWGSAVAFSFFSIVFVSHRERLDAGIEEEIQEANPKKEEEEEKEKEEERTKIENDIRTSHELIEADIKKFSEETDSKIVDFQKWVKATLKDHRKASAEAEKDREAVRDEAERLAKIIKETQEAKRGEASARSAQRRATMLLNRNQRK